jgi:folate-dependent phosphoribosylglycinamide formyltransferase PurN
MSAEERPIVLLAAPGEPTHIVYHRLAAELGLRHVVLEEPVSKKQLIRGRIKRLGLPTVVGQLAFQGALVPALRRQAAPRLAEIRREFGMNPSEMTGALLHRVRSANDEATIELLKALRPAAVAVQGTRILSRKLLSAVDCPFINMHAGLTPLYRGVHGGYWAAASGNPDLCGVTVHLVDPGIDTGRILGQARVQIGPQDGFVTYPYLQLGVGLPLLVRALRAAREGKLEIASAPPGESRLWSHPTAWGYVWRRIARGVR